YQIDRYEFVLDIIFIIFVEIFILEITYAYVTTYIEIYNQEIEYRLSDEHNFSLILNIAVCFGVRKLNVLELEKRLVWFSNLFELELLTPQTSSTLNTLTVHFICCQAQILLVESQYLLLFIKKITTETITDRYILYIFGNNKLLKITHYMLKCFKKSSKQYLLYVFDNFGLAGLTTPKRIIC
ncbi:hypothetical protein ACJX0J_030491, partial [Zea mays]